MIIRNSITTPDGTKLVSRYRHDYVSHTDANGTTYSVDGGLSYLKRAGTTDYIETSVMSDQPHSVIREAFEWGTRGIYGDETLTYIVLKAMSTQHIVAVLETQEHNPIEVRKVFYNELSWRKC